MDYKLGILRGVLYYRRYMLFIAGYHGSGKTTVAEHLSKSRDYIHIERSSTLTSIKDQENKEMPMRVWREEQKRRLGNVALEDMIAEAVRHQYDIANLRGGNDKGIVITGNRSLDKIHYTAANLEDIDANPPTIVALKADVHVLCRRYIERARSDDDQGMSLENFTGMLQREKDAGIKRIFNHADHTVHNTGSKTELLQAFDEILSA